MKKIVLVPDSFKGTMSSARICEIMSKAIRESFPTAAVVSIPVADGGEGSVDAFLSAMRGRRVSVTVCGPRREPLPAFYGLVNAGRTAVIEIAACAGLPLMDGRKNPVDTTTFGVGQLMLDAVSRGAEEIILGLGGSATNDGGCGAAAAAGVRFYDGEGREFVPVGGTLCNICRIEISGIDPRLRAARVTAMCDISNPLAGETGAAYVFGPQKGADADTVEMLDRGLRHLGRVMRDSLGADVSELAGAGAAGGMGAGVAAFFGAELKMGINAVLDTVGFDALAKGADLVLTGEGRLDGSSMRGKVVVGVARRAKKLGIPVAAIVGDIGARAEEAYAEGVDAVFSINRVAVADMATARARSAQDLYAAINDLMRFCKAIKLPR